MYVLVQILLYYALSNSFIWQSGVKKSEIQSDMYLPQH